MLIPSIDSLQIKYLQQNGTYKRSSKRIYEWVFFLTILYTLIKMHCMISMLYSYQQNKNI